MDLQLKNKKALVTGSTSGIGEQIAKTLAAEGVSVLVHGRNETAAKRVVAEIRNTGGTATYVLGELKEESAANEVVSRSLEALGGIDILINNAGSFPVKPWLKTTAKDWVDLFDANVASVVRLVVKLAPLMQKQKWGRIISIGSFLANMPAPFIPSYSTTKLANISQMVSLARELGPDGITCNTISPGTIRTPGMEAGSKSMIESKGRIYSFEEFERAYVQDAKIVVGKIGSPTDIAYVAAFIASPLAGYITGANFRVDGGLLATIN